MNALLILILAVTPSPTPDATPTKRGVVSATTQSFGGQKTFVDGGIVTDSLRVLDGGSVSGVLSADSLVIDGGATINGFTPVTATTAAMTLYVDPLGSDSNACTSTGASACSTLAGALAKLPRFVAHDVTVNVESGTWAGTTYLNNLSLQDASGVTPILTIQGTSWTTVTPATGSGTGTSTGYVAPSSNPVTLGTLTDSTQSWTANELKGYFVLVGANRRTIVGNTSTVLYLNSATGSGAYTIQKPAAQIGPLSISNLNMSGATTANPIQITGLEIVGTGSVAAVACTSVNAGVGTGVLFKHVRARVTGTGFGLVLRACNAASSSQGTFFEGSTVGVSLQNDSAFTDVAGYSRGSVNGIGITSGRLAGSVTSGLFPVAEVTAVTGIPISHRYLGGTPVSSDPHGMTILKAYVRCPSGSTTGAGVEVSGGLNYRTAPNSEIDNVYVENCNTGLRLLTGNKAITTPTQSGGVGGPFQFSGVTTQIDLDGTTYVYATYAALPTRLISGAYGSTLFSPSP